MFGMEYLITFFKLFFQMGFAIVTALFFKPCWNCVATNYLSEYLPDKLESIPYWHMVAILFCITIIGECIQSLTPKIVSVEQKNEIKE